MACLSPATTAQYVRNGIMVKKGGRAKLTGLKDAVEVIDFLSECFCSPLDKTGSDPAE